jgi:hypothetical protein
MYHLNQHELRKTLSRDYLHAGLAVQTEELEDVEEVLEAKIPVQTQTLRADEIFDPEIREVLDAVLEAAEVNGQGGLGR